MLIGTTLIHTVQSDKGNVSETDYTGQFAYNLRLQQDDTATANSRQHNLIQPMTNRID